MRSSSQSNSGTRTIDWKNLTRTIEAALKDELGHCYDERRWIDVVQTGDITGEGVESALIEYCHMGAYTSEAAILRWEAGSLVQAQLRDKNRKPISFSLLRGASVRNGANVTLLPERHAIYVTDWHTDDSGALESCGVSAYVWSPKSKTFDADEKLGRILSRRECEKLRNQQ